MENIISKLIELDFSFLLYIGIELAVLAGIYGWSRRLHKNWRTVINVGIIVLVIRIILFQNPVAWYVYTHTLDSEVIGWRQSSVLYDKFTRFKSTEDIKYVAIGSSQVGYIYGFSGDSASHLSVKSLAGLSPVGLYMYRHTILDQGPEKILLYLSDFDMGRKPSLESMKLSPSQGLYFPEAYASLSAKFSGERFSRTIKEMIVGELFPEYKYSYVFKGYLAQLFNKNEAFPTPSAEMSQEEYTEYQFSQLKKVISEENISTNLYFLNKFISFFEEKDIQVVIFEGQYHPNGYTEKNLLVKKRVQEELEQLEYLHTNVQFLSNSELIEFKAADFLDAYHVKEEAGNKLVEKAKSLNILEN